MAENDFSDPHDPNGAFQDQYNHYGAFQDPNSQKSLLENTALQEPQKILQNPQDFLQDPHGGLGAIFQDALNNPFDPQFEPTLNDTGFYNPYGESLFWIEGVGITGFGIIGRDNNFI